MSTIAPAGPPIIPDVSWPGSGQAGTIVLTFDESPVERRVIEDWLERARPDGARIDVVGRSGSGQLARTLAVREDDPWVVPVRVTWLPPERNGSRAARMTDLLSLTNPRRPSARAQARILRHQPDRCRLVVADAARVSELRRRFLTAADPADDFDRYVRRQAVLALARAERAVTGTTYKVPRLVHQDLCGSRRFADGVARLAQELGEPEAVVRRQASEYIAEMVAGQSRLAIDLWAQFGRFLSRAYTIEADRSRLAELEDLNRRHALVFLPSHRSYLDPLVLRPALLSHGFPPNHTMGGINVSFWPLGPWARRSGYVFIRRSIKDNEIYKFALREYMGYLVRKRFNLEWYIEGGRTRTGKLREPRYGLLNYLVEGFREGAVDDVYLVPTSIVYDQLYEVGAIAAEEHGATKAPESFSWLVGYARAQGRGFGKVYVRFGEPLSLQAALDAADGDGSGRLAVEKVAFEVLHRINRATPVTPISLVALILLGMEERALTLDEVRAVLDPVLAYIAKRDLPAYRELYLDDEEGVRRTLEALTGHGVVTCFSGGPEPVWAISPNRHLEAAFYRNGAAHFFVNRAIAELVLAWVAETPDCDVRRDGWEEALRLRDFLKFEFFFGSKEEFARDLGAELALLDEGWQQRPSNPEEAWALLDESRPHLAHRVLQSFIEAYEVVGELLADRDPSLKIDEKEFLRECLGAGRQWRMQGRLRSSESISKELYTGGLKLARNRGLLEPASADETEGADPLVSLADRRRQFAAEIGGVARRLARIRELAIAELPPPGDEAGPQ